MDKITELKVAIGISLMVIAAMALVAYVATNMVAMFGILAAGFEGVCIGIWWGAINNKSGGKK